MIRAAAILTLVAITFGTWPSRAEDAAILSPEDGAAIPRQGIDPPCDAAGYCPFATVQGRAPAGFWPFVAVRPETSNPRFWIQGLITEVDPDGGFTLDVALGVGENGVGVAFDIFVIAHRDPRRFAAAQILFGPPEECLVEAVPDRSRRCLVSAPVTVLRTR